MLASPMAAPKKTSTKPRASKPAPPTERKRSLLSRTGDDAKRAAERALLAKTLRAHAWNLTHTAEALEMPGPSHVLRAIKDLGLLDDYEAAKASRT